MQPLAALEIPDNQKSALIKGMVRVFEVNEYQHFLLLDVVLEDLPLVSEFWESTDRVYRQHGDVARIVHLISRLQLCGIPCQVWRDMEGNVGPGFFYTVVENAASSLQSTKSSNTIDTRIKPNYWIPPRKQKG